MSAIALILIAISIRNELRFLAIISAAMLAMSIGCFLTIYLKNWSPSDAEKPIGRATIAFAFAIQFGWILVADVRRKRGMVDL